MSVLVVGLNYRGVPLELLERFAFASDQLPKALHAARSSEHVREAVILSTCNRTEIYARVDGYHAGVTALKQFLSDFHHVPLEDFADRVYALYEEEAVRHAFAVAAGIDSMVVGEPQILSQVRQAFRVASDESSIGPTLSALFRQAISAGRRVRAETSIGRIATSFAQAAVGIARDTLGSLRDRCVLVIGAGAMSKIAVEALSREGARLLIANRTPDRARPLAARADGEVLALEELVAGLTEADVVLASTGSVHPVVTADAVAAAIAARGDRTLLVFDLALPRDVEPGVAALPGVALRDLEDLRDAVGPVDPRSAEVEKATALVDAETTRFLAWQRAHGLAPLLAALQGRAEAVREAELRRAMKVLGGLGDREREAVEALSRAIVTKLLHDPVTIVKKHAGTPDGEALVQAMRALYDLPEEGE